MFDTHQVVTEPLGDLHRIRLVDQSQPLAVARSVCAPGTSSGLLDQWVEVTNLQDAPVTLHEVAASAPALSGDDPRLDHFCGGWAQEFTPVHDHLTPGTKVLEARGTTRPNHESAPYLRFSPDGPANESDGVTLAAALAGRQHPHRPRATDDRPGPRLAGANCPSAPIRPGPRREVRDADGGVDLVYRRHPDVSRSLHRYARRQVVRDGRRPRAIVANNWEATFFAFDEERLGWSHRAADAGRRAVPARRRLVRHQPPPRRRHTSLGDWEADPAKLPAGLAPLAAAGRGLRFGIWVEPEMVNPGQRSARRAIPTG